MIDATGFQRAILDISRWIITKSNFFSSRTVFVTPSTFFVTFNGT